jgi:hypothetical protein
MKTLKFRRSLSKLILQGKKNTTWRLFDDKNLSTDDEVSFLVYETKKEFAKAKLTSIKETSLGKSTNEDWDGHKKFSSDEEMYKTYCGYYNRPVDKDTPVKIIKFKLLRSSL